MGKKLKKKARNAHKDKGVSSGSSCSVPESRPTAECENERVSVAKEGELCNHIDRGVDLDKISWNIGSESAVKCEDCGDGPACDKKAGKGSGKRGTKKGVRLADTKLDPKCIWVCLACGHCACGGADSDLRPQSHALRHARLTRHPCVVQFDNPLIGWCFSCNSVISTGKTEEHGKRKDILSEAQELIKRCSLKGDSTDVEDIWFGGGEKGKKIENGESLVLDARNYMIKGLLNLGNTCFFNSVVQNLLAMDLLRTYFMNLEQSIGPLTGSLKKLFNETSNESDLKSCISPKALFGCICSKAPQFRGYQQQDSHELLRYLLDALHTEELGARKALITSGEVEVALCSPYTLTFVDAIFGGQLSSTVCCVECGHSSIVHEPLLDLSLPVPMKKPLSKKAQISRPKKTKTYLKEGNKGGKFPERSDNATSVSTQSATVVSLPSEGSKSSCTAASNDPAMEQTIPLAEVDNTWWLDFLDPQFDCSVSSNKPDTEQTIPLAEGENTWLDYLGPAEVDNTWRLDFLDPQFDCSISSNKPDTEQTIPLAEGDNTWLDYLGPDLLPDDVSSVPQNYDISAIENFKSTQFFHNEDVIQGTSEVLSSAFSPSQDEFCRDDLPLLAQDSKVLLLPYKEEVSTTEEIVAMQGYSHNPGTTVGEDASIKDVNMTASSVNGWEQTELDFDGFGDLFNEPETVADMKTEFRPGDPNFQANEEVDLALFAGNSSDSNQDEVDNTDAQVSIDSCLASFTKSELLSDEHAWQCENCSKILRDQMVEASGVKGQVVTMDKLPTSLKHQANRGEFTASVNGDLRREENSANALKILSPCMERLDAASAVAEQNMVNQADVSNSNVREFGKLGDERVSDFLHPVSNGLAQYPEMSQVDGDLGMSNHTSEGIASTSFHVESGMQVNSCGSNSENAFHSSKEKDTLGKVDKGKKKVAHSSFDGNKLADNESEDVDSESTMVMRNATKRILISKAPSILTIHLKRFSQDGRGRLNKLTGHVSFREMLDLLPYMDPRCGDREKCLYHLVGVVEHLGTMRGGHYVAYVRGARRGKTEKDGGSSTWFYASDAHVREVSLTEVLRSEAYILFYEKM